MKEDFLHYVWQYKKFDFSNLITASGESLTVLNVGQYLKQSGPDFFNAQIIIGNQKWAGNIEIHLKSSDWYLHYHEKDPRYDNVILHVVWEFDTPVYRKDNSEIPTLVLKPFVDRGVYLGYKSLITPKKWINCENQILSVNYSKRILWQERLYFERLERKANQLSPLLRKSQNDWELVLFSLLAKNFGLNTNGDIFFELSQNLSMSILRKEKVAVNNLEALFFGMLQLLPEQPQDGYAKSLKRNYNYLKLKYNLIEPITEPLQFFKLRPDNFPTIRLAQLAMLYHKEPYLLDAIITAKSNEELRRVFRCSTSEYWETHYNFDRESPKKVKRISQAFIDLLIINTVLPFRFAYFKAIGNEQHADLNLISEIKAEQNTITKNFARLGINSKNALESQSLLQMKNEYCNFEKCLQCGIGIELLKA